MSENIHVRELFSLAGRVALVTGGAGRYGRQIVLALAEAGARVIIASRDLEKCRHSASEVQAQGLASEALALDITSDSSVDAMAQAVRKQHGGLDVLVNAAAAVAAGGLEQHDPAAWQRALECNGAGLYRVCRALAPLMEGRRASIINIASIYGVVSPDFRAYEHAPEIANPPSYGFAKAGAIQLTRYLAVYLAPRGIRVNCLSPGGLFAHQAQNFVANYVARTPLGRMAGPNDLKGAVLFLASDASAYVTGQNLLVDGGLTAL